MNCMCWLTPQKPKSKPMKSMCNPIQNWQLGRIKHLPLNPTHSAGCRYTCLASLLLSSLLFHNLSRVPIPPPAHCSTYFSLISSSSFLSKLSAFTSVCLFICLSWQMYKLYPQNVTLRMKNYLNAINMQLSSRWWNNLKLLQVLL